MIDVSKIHWAVIQPWMAIPGVNRGPLYSTKRAAILDSVQWVSTHGWCGKSDDIVANRQPTWWCIVPRDMLRTEFYHT